jgi:uncharacterized membrane protein YraQ (UPF0718 family)
MKTAAGATTETGKPRRPGAWLFLAGVLLAWLAAAVLAPARVGPALDLFRQLLGEVLPALGLVFVLLFLANLFAERPWIERHLGREAGVRAWLVALAAGVLAAGPPWPWYALAGQFMRRGIAPGVAAAFLYARAVKLPLLPLLVHYFGLAYAVTLGIWLLLLAVLGGLAMERLAPAPASDFPASFEKKP